jgi:hypothetical protein
MKRALAFAVFHIFGFGVLVVRGLYKDLSCHAPKWQHPWHYKDSKVWWNIHRPSSHTDLGLDLSSLSYKLGDQASPLTSLGLRSLRCKKAIIISTSQGCWKDFKEMIYGSGASRHSAPKGSQSGHDYNCDQNTAGNTGTLWPVLHNHKIQKTSKLKGSFRTRKKRI